MAESSDGDGACREIDAAKHRLATARTSASFASRIAESATQRVSALQVQVALAQSKVESAQSQLRDCQLLLESSRSQLNAAEADVKLTTDNVVSCQKEVSDAELFLKDVAERRDVIDLHDEQTVIVSNSSNRDFSDNGKSSVKVEEGNETSSKLKEHPLVITTFQVEGCKIDAINGIYTIFGGYPSYERNDGAPVYWKVTNIQGERKVFILHRRTCRDNFARRWAISMIRESSPYKYCHFSPKINYEGLFPPKNNWKRQLGSATSTLCISPGSGYDENGKEVIFKETALSDEIEKTRVIVEGCGLSEINGIYGKGGDYVGAPSYTNKHYRIVLGRDQRWEIRKILSEGNQTEPSLYQSRIAFPDSRSEVDIPSSGWEVLADSTHPAPCVRLFVAIDEHHANSRKRQRQS